MPCSRKEGCLLFDINQPITGTTTSSRKLESTSWTVFEQVALHFVELEFDEPQLRTFDVKISAAGKMTHALKDFDIYHAAGQPSRPATSPGTQDCDS